MQPLKPNYRSIAQIKYNLYKSESEIKKKRERKRRDAEEKGEEYVTSEDDVEMLGIGRFE